MKSLEKKLSAEWKHNISSATEALQISVYLQGKKLLFLKLGRDYQFFDLASLTKIIFGVSKVLFLVRDKKINLKTDLQSYMPFFSQKLVLENLLSHSAGFHWWYPFYKELKAKRYIPEIQWQKLKRQLRHCKQSKSNQANYSDIDFFFLGCFFEEFEQKPLLSQFYELQEIWQLENLFFHPENKAKYSSSLYAPTEICSWRKNKIQAQVHDENCYSLGGVSMHAGLFADLETLSAWSLSMRDSYYANESFFLPSQLLRKFTKKKSADWALGYMLPTYGSSSSGQYFHPSSFGHTGFTGTSVWFDPKKDLLVNLLSNRTYPKRENKDFVYLRPKIHDMIYEYLSKEGLL